MDEPQDEVPSDEDYNPESDELEDFLDEGCMESVLYAVFFSDGKLLFNFLPQF